MLTPQIDLFWLLGSTCLLFIMQAGYFCLSVGFSTRGATQSSAIRNVAQLALAALIFWLIGYAIMFGSSFSGLIGTSQFMPHFVAADGAAQTLFFLFSLMTCVLTVAIVSSSVAERLSVTGHIIVAVIISAIIFPIFGHWVWNGVTRGTTAGWLAQLGFVDFAGSTVVHSVAGWGALAAIMLLGGRTNRFSKHGKALANSGSNIPLASFGILLIYLGWFGLTGGSNLRFDATTPTILFNTLLGGSCGLASGIIASWAGYGKPTPRTIIISCIAGLVAISAGAAAVTPTAAALIGAIGGLLAPLTLWLLDRLQLDDALGIVAAHLVPGIWGTLALGIFGDARVLGSGLGIQQQIGAQLVGIAVCGLWAFGATWLLLSLVNLVYPLRVSAETSPSILSTVHKADRELSSFARVIQMQAQSGDLSLRMPVDQFTEYGPIAANYNYVVERLQQSAQQAQAIVDQSRDGIIMFAQEDLAIRVINPAAQTIFGVSAEVLRNQPLTQLLNLDLIGTPRPIFNNIITSGRPYEFIGKRGDGSEFPLEIALSATTISSESVYVGTFRNVAERVEQQEELQSANEKLVKNNQYKDQFMAAMSHELRTPLNAILGMSEALDSEVYGEINSKQRTATHHIRSSGQHLLTLIDEILDLSKISAGKEKLDYFPVSVGEVCHTSIALISSQAASKSLQFIAKYDERVQIISADPKRLKQILVNLLSNAVKFTDSGNKIGLMTVGSPKEKLMHFIVWDTGIGIPDEEMPQLFQPFVQGDGSYARRYGGAGLGLAIVKRLVDLHGGYIRVASDVGQGSRFIVSLPWDMDNQSITAYGQEREVDYAAIDETVVATIAEMESAEYRAPTILIAEDNEANLKTLRDYLEMHGYAIELARNGVEALKQIELTQPDIVLMDIQMPEMDGLTAIRQLRTLRNKASLPIIALTAFAMPGDREKCLAAGANEYISKPISLKHLIQTIQQQLLTVRD